ncbi:hypothetical protein HT031_003832 [Scenedesmus sp. PABB004]|nr:hypothetical protein HT031_003832 [Scenedesmus sp. PABB004]
MAAARLQLLVALLLASRGVAAAAPRGAAAGRPAAAARALLQAPADPGAADSLAAVPRVTRWVVTAWSVSNFSSPELLTEAAVRGWTEAVSSIAQMQPGQVVVNATANVTLGFAFDGILPRDLLVWVPKHAGYWDATVSAVIRRVAAQAAGGYDPQLITVLFEAPDYGLPPARWNASGTSNVTERNLTRTSSGGGGGAGAAQGKGAPRRLLQAPPGARAGTLQGLTPVWVVFTQLVPGNVSALLGALNASCGGGGWAVGADVTGTPCGVATQQGLQAAGLRINDTAYTQRVAAKPMVSLSIRLAVGVTDAQASAGVDHALAAWLAQPAAVQAGLLASGAAAKLGEYALIKWLRTPEILVDAPAREHGGATYWTPGRVAGIAIGMAAAFGAAVGGVVYALLRLHRRRHPAPAAAQKQGSGSTTPDSSQPSRRRRQGGKKRYLLPEPQDPAAAGAAPAGCSAAAGGAEEGARAGADAAPAAAGDSYDQLRPALKELGDSVTSAVRWEQGDDDDGGEPAPPGAAAAAGVGAGAAAAAAAAAAAHGRVLRHGSSGGGGGSGRQRSALSQPPPIAEQAPQPGGPGGTSGAAALAGLGGVGSPVGARASPFALAYDFSDLADPQAAPPGGWLGTPEASVAVASAVSGSDGSGPAGAAAPAGRGCPAGMVSAGSSLGAAALAGGAGAGPGAGHAGAGSLRGSLQIAVARDGSFKSLDPPAPGALAGSGQLSSAALSAVPSAPASSRVLSSPGSSAAYELRSAGSAEPPSSGVDISAGGDGPASAGAPKAPPSPRGREPAAARVAERR